MIINIKKCKIAYINLDSFPNRNETMIRQLQGFDYVRVDGIKADSFDGVGEAHVNALATGASIILEDDCLPYDYREIINVPGDADVVFLGISTGTTHTHVPKYVKASDDIYRLYDMTTTHAILYLTEAGKQWLRNAHELAKKDNIGFDIATARLMPTIKAYGLNSPIWYQKDLVSQTKKTLDEALLSDEYFGGGYNDYQNPIDF